MDYWQWKVTLDELTQGQPWLEDQICEWPVIRLLNEIAYRKDKNDTMERIRLMSIGT